MFQKIHNKFIYLILFLNLIKYNYFFVYIFLYIYISFINYFFSLMFFLKLYSSKKEKAILPLKSIEVSLY
jgi:hypothetical protein